MNNFSQYKYACFGLVGIVCFGVAFSIWNNRQSAVNDLIKQPDIVANTVNVEGDSSSSDQIVLSNASKSTTSIEELPTPHPPAAREVLNIFNANSYFPTENQVRDEVKIKIIESLGLDQGRSELVERAISERFESEVAINNTYEESLSDYSLSDIELKKRSDEYDNNYEVIRQEYVNKLTGILTSEEFQMYKETEKALIKDYLSSRIPRAAARLAEEGHVNIEVVNRNIENELDRLIDENVKTGISLGLVKNDSGSYNENDSRFNMLMLSTKIFHEMTN